MKNQTLTQNLRFYQPKKQQEKTRFYFDNIDVPEDIQRFNHANAVYHNNNHNLNKKSNVIWLGDIKAAQNIQWLKQKNIKTVFTIGQGFKIKYDASIRNYKYSLYDHKNQKVYGYFDEVSQKIDKALKLSSILVHCGAGVSRSTTFVIAYLIKYKRLTFAQALRMIKDNRPSVCPNLGFQLQLKAYCSFLNYQIPKQKNHKNLIFPTKQKDGYNQQNDLIREDMKLKYKYKQNQTLQNDQIIEKKSKSINHSNIIHDKRKEYDQHYKNNFFLINKKKDLVKSTVGFNLSIPNNNRDKKNDLNEKRKNTHRSNHQMGYVDIYPHNTDSQVYQSSKKNQEKNEGKESLNSLPQINKKQIIGTTLAEPSSIFIKKNQKKKSKQLTLSINIDKLRQNMKERIQTIKSHQKTNTNLSLNTNKYNNHQQKEIKNKINYHNKGKKFDLKGLISETKDIKLENYTFIKSNAKNGSYNNTPGPIISQQYLRKIAQFRFGITNAQKWNVFRSKSP